MGRTTWNWLTVAALAGLLVACGDGMDEDAGVDGSVTDAGPPRTDAGPPDAGPPTPDAGPTGCQGAGCEFVEITTSIVNTCGRRGNGEVLCWGRNQEYQLGDGSLRHMDCATAGQDPEDCSGRPINVRYQSGATRPRIEDATAITARGFTSHCALRGGELWCWSNAVVNPTGGGEPEPLRVAEQLFPTISDVGTASVSGSLICFTRGATNALSCAGVNNYGQLGRGERPRDMENMPAAVMVGTAELDDVQQAEVSFGGFVCARTSDEVYCWGVNRESQLGDSSSHEVCVVDVTESFDCSSSPVVVGDPMGTSLGATADIALGRRHACAIQGTAPGQVVCWGDNRGGAAGQADVAASVRLPAPVAGMTDIIDVSAGGDFSCALHMGGTVSCWGLNRYGELGDGSLDHGQQCMVGSVMEDCSPAPVTVANINDATAISVGSSHACALRADGSVWCWGNNESAQLGDGSRTDRSEPVMAQMTGPSM